MKKLKKFMAVLLSVVMVLAMGATVFAAAPTPGTLTVNITDGSLKNQKIYLFKLFDYTETDPATYTANANYKDALKDVLSVTSNDDYDLYAAIAALGADNATEVQTFANDFTEKIISNGQITGSSPADYQVVTVADDVKTYGIADVDPGYYLVYLGGSVQIQSSLVTVNGNTTVSLKSETPTPDKTAYDSTGTKPVNDVQIGDILTYKVTAKIPDISAYDQASYTFTLKDTLSDGLDFVASDGSAVTTTMTVNVTVDGSPIADQTANVSGKSMTLALAEVIKSQQGNIGKDLVVTYYAQVNENAVTNNTSNSASLEYTNDPSTNGTGESIPDVVTTPTFALNVHKYAKGAETEYLAGAEFQLHKDTAQGTVIKMAGTEDNDGNYVVAKDQNTAILETLVTAAKSVSGDWNLQINGLAAGTYYLVETKTPNDEYNLADPIKIEIINKAPGAATPSYKITVNDGAETDIAGVENVRGTILPGTGGMGTIIFTVVGVLLICGVAISFVVSRKRSRG